LFRDVNFVLSPGTKLGLLGPNGSGKSTLIRLMTSDLAPDGGEIVLAGNILARQRGTKWHAGRNVGTGKDHTLFALIDGKVQFATKAKGRTYVSVVPMTEAAAE